jgi:hypothetical protein
VIGLAASMSWTTRGRYDRLEQDPQYQRTAGRTCGLWRHPKLEAEMESESTILELEFSRTRQLSEARICLSLLV